jgi:hypothetical protein
MTAWRCVEPGCPVSGIAPTRNAALLDHLAHYRMAHESAPPAATDGAADGESVPKPTQWTERPL